MQESIYLESDRLILRRLKESDFPRLIRLATNKEIAANTLNIPYPYTQFNAIMRMSYITQGYNEKSRFVFAIALKETDEFIGEISLHIKEVGIAECAYWLGEDYWIRGFTTEALKSIMSFGFNKIHLDQIFASCRATNGSSIRVLEKASFKYVKSAGKINYYKMMKDEFSSI